MQLLWQPEVSEIIRVPQSGVDPREHRGLSELRKDPLCLGQMLNRKGAFFLGLVEQAENHFRAANIMPLLDRNADSPGRASSRRECVKKQ